MVFQRNVISSWKILTRGNVIVKTNGRKKIIDKKKFYPIECRNNRLNVPHIDKTKLFFRKLNLKLTFSADKNLDR